MSNSMKDALIKAGVISQAQIDVEKEKERREKIQRKGPAQHGVHAHHIRTDCAQCGKTSPDVEFYEHTNKSVQAKWLCIPCADKSWINDECRMTNQSSHAKAGRFRREFGRTKKFPANTPSTPAAPTQGQQHQNKPRQQGPPTGKRKP